MTNTITFAFNTTDKDFDVFPLLAKLENVTECYKYGPGKSNLTTF